jgi:hypothetical protein
MKIFTTILLILTAASVLAPPPPLTPSTDQLAQLTPEQLVQEYEACGLAKGRTYSVPVDLDLDEPQTIGRPSLLDTIASEIVRRGEAMVPALVKFLEREVPTKRTSHVSFPREILGMLRKISDPHAVPTILRVLEGGDGKASHGVRSCALRALEEITHVHFSRMELDVGANFTQCVEHPKAVSQEDYVQLDIVAKLYHERLAGEGKDSKQWLNLACKRAYELLSSDDPERRSYAVAFLTRGAGRKPVPQEHKR